LCHKVLCASHSESCEQFGVFPYEKGVVMALIARIIGLSLFTAGAGAGLGFALFGQNSPSSGRQDWIIISVLLACAGGIIGAIAGTAWEIVIALRQRPSS
jgi:hypothetical protein